MADDLFPFPTNFRKMGYALERMEKLDIALKSYSIHGGVLVDQNTANIRAKLCASCHNNIPEKQARNGSIVSEVDVCNRVLKEIIKDHATPHDAQLQHCNIDGGNNRLSAWLPIGYLIDSGSLNEFPCFCWKKKD